MASTQLFLMCMAYNMDIEKAGNEARILVYKYAQSTLPYKGWRLEQFLLWDIRRTNARRNVKTLILWLPMLFLVNNKSSRQFIHYVSFAFTDI